MKIIDLENHFSTKLCNDEDAKIGGSDLQNGMPENTGKNVVRHTDSALTDMGGERLLMMDKNGIDFVQLSLTAPGVEVFPTEIAKKVAKNANDLLAQHIHGQPQRYGGWMALAADDPEWTIQEIDRCLDNGLWGWNCHSNICGSYLDEPKYWPVLEKVNEVGMPIYLHPNYTTVKALDEFGICLGGPSLGFTVDVQICLMRMIYRGVFDSFPNLKIILGHYGEAFPFLMDRVDAAYRQDKGMPTSNIKTHNEHEPSYYLKHNMWVTTSGNYLPEALELSLKVMGPEKIMFASDHPYDSAETTVNLIMNSDVLTEREKSMIFSENAEKLGFASGNCD